MHRLFLHRLFHNSILSNFLIIALILFGSALISVQLRVKLSVGAELGANYVSHPYQFFLLIGLGASLSTILIHVPLFAKSRNDIRFFAVVISTFVIAVASVFLLPDISQLQLIYFVASALLISLITLRWTPIKNPLSVYLTRLWNNRALLRLWVRYNVISRYSQTTLGILWIIMLPLSTSLILAFVFSNVLRAGDVGDVPFVSFFLTALAFWSLFMQSILTGNMSIRAKLDLINQIYFPREILVIVKLGEALVDLSFTLAATLVINAVLGVLPNIYYVFLPFLLIVQIMFTLGLMFFVSYLSVFIRDLAQLVSVILQMLFYLTPVLYPVTILPENVAQIFSFLNPMAALITAYRAIIVYNEPPDFTSLYFATVISVIFLYTGYMFFKHNEGRLTDFK